MYKLKKLRSNSATSVLFVGRENAARSLIAEACLRHLGKERFQVFSCGVPGKTLDKPSDWVLMALRQAGISTEGLHCKDWSAYARRGALSMDYVVALDEAALRAHPPWPGQPEQALWSFAPLIDKKHSGMERGLAAIQTLHSLRRRIELLVSLQARAASPQDLRHDLRDLAHM